ncbi:hypothetical protein [Dendronalium sp. ChiSLP03b]|uniref:hypothetical protein n=1 Tax=Dendronalium sp. ChiSLP03b TaxID=3075381 RepID=UPI002AD4D8F2|nr:hypothetical protein [Dendronalium sp. ChiSLP03b]MDZ8203816.1 hypothetical protein [Dendronalium sp. ChiSLP03b]
MSLRALASRTPAAKQATRSVCNTKSEVIAKSSNYERVYAIATLREGSAYVVSPLYETLRERNDSYSLIAK